MHMHGGTCAQNINSLHFVLQGEVVLFLHVNTESCKSFSVQLLLQMEQTMQGGSDRFHSLCKTKCY